MTQKATIIFFYSSESSRLQLLPLIIYVLTVLIGLAVFDLPAMKCDWDNWQILLIRLLVSSAWYYLKDGRKNNDKQATLNISLRIVLQTQEMSRNV